MKRVLVVEDHAETRSILGQVLAELGCEAMTAACAAEALAKFEASELDVVLLDIGLPDASGHDVAARMRQRSRTTTIVVLSAWSTPQDIARAREVGVNFYVIKPVDVETLRGLLESADRGDWAEGSSSWPHEQLRKPR